MGAYGCTLRLWQKAGKARNADEGTSVPRRALQGSLPAQEKAPMKTTLLTLALVAAAGVASAQTASTPAAGATTNNSTITNGNTGMQGAQMGVGTQSQMNSNVRSPATGQMNGHQMNGNTSASGAAGASVNPSVANAPS